MVWSTLERLPVITTSARLLALLGLLQNQESWRGAALAQRLGVGERTIRTDVARLRALGYPVNAVSGPAGGYRLGDRGRIPPLLLDDNEAVAVAVGLGQTSVMPGLAEAGAQALAKLDHVLPHRLRRRVEALSQTTEFGPDNTGTNVAAPDVPAERIGEIADAVRDHVGIRFHYAAPGQSPEPAEIDPYRLVSWQQRWYAVGRRQPGHDWAVFRVDWMTLRIPGGSRFRPDGLPGGDYASLVLREVATTGWRVHARIAVDASAEKVLRRINPAVGVVETLDEDHSILVTGADSLETVAVWIGMLGLDFHVDSPPELRRHLQQLADRYLAAARRP